MQALLHPFINVSIRILHRLKLVWCSFSHVDSECSQMTTVAMGVMSWVVFTHAPVISTDAPVADAYQVIGLVMVTMTVETSVMKPKQTAPKKVSYFNTVIKIWSK